MKCIAYVAVEGEGFSPTSVHSPGMASFSKGEFVKRKHLGVTGRAVGAQEFFWKSEVVSGEKTDIERKLSDLLDELSNDLNMIRAINANVDIHCRIVIYKKNSDDVSGFYLPTELVGAMASLDCDLDIDIVEDTFI